MTEEEKDELLIRLDERTDSISIRVDRIIEHQIKQNGSIIKNTIWRKVMVGTGSALFLCFFGWLLRLTFGG